MTDAEDQRMLARLRGMWTAADPVPADLADAVLASLEADGLDEEWALLELVLSEGAGVGGLVGVRGTDAAVRTVQFSDGVHEVLLRVSPQADGGRRVDGWATPPEAGAVVARVGGTEVRVPLDDTGRFELVDLPAGTAELAFSPAAGGEPTTAAGTHPLGWKTPAFEL